MTPPHEGHEPEGSKQHAKLLAHTDQIRPFWVYDDEDWAYLRGLPSGSLICPEPGCRVRFKRPIQNRHGTRWLANLPGEWCSHYRARPVGNGGPLSPQHRWLTARLARLCELLGYEAVTEHYETDSDVYVPGASYSLEVQRWDTKFAKRTLARQRKGARVIWFVSEDAKGTAAAKAVFLMPAVRLRVESRDDGRIALKPWDHEQQNRDAILKMFATVARLDRTGKHLITGKMDAYPFLKQILGGERLWYPPGTEGAPRDGGFWARPSDLARVRQVASAEREQLLQRRKALRPTTTPPEPPVAQLTPNAPGSHTGDDAVAELPRMVAPLAPPTPTTPHVPKPTKAVQETSAHTTETPTPGSTANSTSLPWRWWRYVKERLIRQWFIGS